MGCRRHIALFGLAGLALFLPSALRAQEVADGAVSVIHVPDGSRIEWAVADGWSSDWEVTVTVDTEHCDVYCAIRRKRDSLGRVPAMDLLLPPVVQVRIFSDGVSKPVSLILDPAGRRSPSANRTDPLSEDTFCIPSPRESVTGLPACESVSSQPEPVRTGIPQAHTAGADRAVLPLRI